jgi:hypothetical protein
MNTLTPPNASWTARNPLIGAATARTTMTRMTTRGPGR